MSSSDPAPEEEVKEELEKLKKAADTLNMDYKFVWEDSTNDFFRKHGVLRKNVCDVMDNFTIENYFKGPENDHSGKQGDIWVFKFDFKNKRIYIKYREFKKHVFCFKIHEDDGSEECPYKSNS